MKSQSAVRTGFFLLVVVAGAVALAANPKAKDAVHPPEVDTFELMKAPVMDGVQARALSVAFRDFERRGLEIAGYDVRVLRRPDDFVVGFLARTAGDDQTVGGDTAGIVYVVSKEGRLLKVQFSR